MNRVRYIRVVIFGISQAAFAEIAKTTQPTVSRWEDGKGGPNFQQFQRIRAEALRRNLEWDDAQIFGAAA